MMPGTQRTSRTAVPFLTAFGTSTTGDERFVGVSPGTIGATDSVTPLIWGRPILYT